ncbi:MBL fold metallo-hydrolase [Candidatus Bipolaricaulota bacterium]
MVNQIHQFQHHDIDGAVIRVLDDEILSVNEFLPPEHRLDTDDEFEFAYTCCYLRHRGKNVLIDAGFDPDTTPGALESIDVLPEDIDLVLITHGDRDHVVGLIMHDGSLTYPNAQHVMSKELWDYLELPDTLDAMPEDRASFYRRFVRAFDETSQLCDKEVAVSDGILFIPSPGHRMGHAVFQFEADGSPLIYSADAFQHILFAEHPDWPNVTDSDPDQAMKSRRALVSRAIDSEALVLATHIPFPGIGFIREQGARYHWEAANS